MGQIISPPKRRKSSSSSSPEPATENVYDMSWIEAVKNSYVFVWCDGTIGLKNNIDDDKNTLSQLAQVGHKYRQLIHTFNEIKTCESFMSQMHNVCLIISGSLGHELVPMIHNQEKIHSIYVFCMDKAKHESWASSYKKVRGVFTDIRSICESMQSTLTSRPLSNYDQFVFDVIAQKQDPSNDSQQELALIHSKLSEIILYKMNSADRGKQEMIQYCRSSYTGDYQVQLINEFERNYSHHHPFWWYTRDIFFQGILNRALNGHDLYTLCSMYRFLNDLNTQLVQLHNSTAASNRDPLTLYFGNNMSIEDFNRIQCNLNGLLLIDQFISANPEAAIPMVFLKQQASEKKSDGKVRVLFKITIDRSVPSIVAYGNIGASSQFVHEKEFLISMGSIYRLDAVGNLDEIPSAFLVSMTLISRNDLQYNLLTQCVQREQWEEEVNLTDLGANLLKKFHLFKSTNKLFKKAFRSKTNEFRYMMLHFNMAIILTCMSEHEKALEEYRYALALARHDIPNGHTQDDLCLIPLYSHMALTYQQENRFTYAIEHAFRALGIATKSADQSDLNKELTATCYHTLGIIHDQERKYTDARKFYEQALVLRQSYLPLGHTDITILQRNITILTGKTSDNESM